VTELLLLRAEDAEDLKILSACVQDMTVKPVDVGWQPRNRRLVLIGNRYRWEAKAPTRIRSALRFEAVLRVERREWPDEGHAVLPLLAVTAEEDGVLLLRFGGGTALRLHVEAVDITLEDLSGPWGAAAVPAHGQDLA
jgi:hypothetical protein